MQEYVSPRLAALALGTSESSLKRWADKGLVPVTKTAGGHRRISVAGLVEFARAHGYPVQRPDMLGLPTAEVRGTPDPALIADELAERLANGDESWVRRMLVNVYGAGARIAAIVDRALAPAFRLIGDRWAHGDVEVFEEHRASAIALRVLHELRLLLPPARPDAPLAMGGTLAGDWYSLPITCADLVLHENGWRTTLLASSLPVTSFVHAIERHEPRLVFLSLSYVDNAEVVVESVEALRRAADRTGSFLVLGGSALTPDLLARMRFGAACESMTRLEDLVRGLVR